MANSFSRRNAITGATASLAATAALALPTLAIASTEGPMDRQIIERIAAVRLAIAQLDDAGIPHSEAEEAEFEIKRDVPAILLQPLPLLARRQPDGPHGWKRDTLETLRGGYECVITSSREKDGMNETMVLNTEYRKVPNSIRAKASEMLAVLHVYETRVADASEVTEQASEVYMECVGKVSSEISDILQLEPDSFTGLAAKAALLADSFAFDVAFNEGRGLECLIADIDRIASKGNVPAA